MSTDVHIPSGKCNHCGEDFSHPSHIRGYGERPAILAAWSAGDKIVIGDFNGADGAPIIAIPRQSESLLQWVGVLLRLLEDDGPPEDLPGEMGKMTGETLPGLD